MEDRLLKKIVYVEHNFPKLFSNYEDTDFGIVFYNENINVSHDSNHAIIYNSSIYDIDEIVKNITVFYEAKNIVPRIYTSLFSGQLNQIYDTLIKNNYHVEQYNNIWLIHDLKHIKNEPYTINIKRINSENQALAMDNFFDNDWGYNLLKRQIKNRDFHLLIGFENNIPVSKCTIQCIDNIGRVDDVETKTEYRGKGYSRQMIRYLIEYNYEICKNEALYLWYNNPIAGKIYREMGFIDYENNFECWNAYKK
jgi:GNAT superfamily N-acetyltransferase